MDNEIFGYRECERALIRTDTSLNLLYALISHFANLTVPGWTALVCSIWLLGGIQLLCLGVVGEYVGKIFSEVKQRPRYIIDEIFFNE